MLDQFETEVEDVLDTYAKFPPLANRPISRLGAGRPAREGCIIHLYDLWGRYVRAVVLTSTVRDCRTVDGMVFERKLDSYRKANEQLHQSRRSIVNFSHGEPSWHLPGSALDAIAVLAPRNNTALRAVIGATITSSATGSAQGQPITVLAATRNFVAHKGKSAAVKLAPILSHSTAGSLLEWMDQPSGGITNFEELASNVRFLGQQLVRS